MQSVLDSEHQKSGPSATCALWPVDLKLTHLDWNPEASLIHFQGQYLSICDLDYNILQGEIQNIPKTKAAVDIGQFCLVEDLVSGRWYRGRVQNRKKDLFDVFLIDHGSVLSVDICHISSCSNDLFILPPKIVCGFLANVLLIQGCFHSVEVYFSNLIGRNVTGYIQALLPHKVLLLEAPDINVDLVRHGFGRHVDTDTFLLLVGMLTEVPLKQNIEPVPDLLIEKPRGQELCFRTSGLQGYEEIRSLCGPRLSCGTRAKVRVTAAVNPGLFYCQMTSMETDLWEMSKKLAAVNECRTKEHNQKTPENLGLLCSVKGKDGKWHRGFVQFLPVNSQLRVLFIDYGFFESVKVENVHRLPPDLFSTPIIAFPCSLSSLSVQDEAVKTQQLSFLKAGLLGKVLDVEIQGFDAEQHLYIISIISAEDNLVMEPGPIQELPSMKFESVFEEEEISLQSGHLFYEKIMGEALYKSLEEEEVHEDSVFVGYVEHVQDPSHFWIRTQKRNGEFEEMMTKITDTFSQVKLDEDVLLNPELGTLCCAVYEEDMHFYRGVVTDTLEHGSEVLFIDFGNIEKVPKMLIKKIPETLASNSAFAFCCTLVNVFPLDEVWTTTASDFFRQAVSNKALLVHVIQMRKNKFVVDLRDMGSEDNRSITELLIASKQAEYWNNFAIQHVVQNHTDLTEKEKCSRYTATLDVSGYTEPLKDREDEEKTCKNQTEKAPASFKALSFKPGCNFAVRCNCIKSPSEFWCQCLDKLPALEELMGKVNQYYSTHTVPLQTGDSCCVAKSPQDGRWYRAFIIEKKNGHANVILVDYGFTMQIEEHNLQAILPEYICLEGQAFRCSLWYMIKLADLKNSGDWSPEMCKLLKELILASTSSLMCKVVSQLTVQNKWLWCVELYNTQTQQSITNMLSAKGLTREMTVSTKQLLTVFPESFVYSSYDLNPGNEEQVFITHVSSQWEIYFHLERNTEIIEKLENKISEESEKIKQASTSAVVRKLLLAKYLDGKWYRAMAHPVKSPLHNRVFFVDYGNTNISEKAHVMCITRDCADLLFTPMQAVKCHLASVAKEELYADVKEWLDGAILNKQVKAVIVGVRDDGSFDVELFDGDVNINEKVKDLVRSLAPKPKTVLSVDMSSTKTKQKKIHTGNTKTKSQQKVQSSNFPSLNASRCTQVGRASCNKKKTPKNNVYERAQNKSPTEKRQRECHDPKIKSEQPGHTEETETIQLSCLPDLKVSAGLRAECFVSHINSVNSFFLQLSEDEPAILKMGEVLNSNILRDSLKSTQSFKVNDLVLAEYEEDGALYRSAVKDCDGSSHFKVEFVDYGNSAVLGKENVYSIPKEFLSQPRFSIACSLLDTSTYEDDASFTDAVMEKPLMVYFVRHHEDHWEVKIEILDGAVGLPAALELAVGSSIESENDEEFHADSSEIDEKVQSCEQKSLRKEASAKETTQSERIVFDVQNFMLKPMPATPSPKLEDHGRTPTRNSEFREFNLDTSPPQQLICAPIDMDKAYSGIAAAVTTPLEFCIVLEDLLFVMNKVSIMLDDLPGQMCPLPEAQLIPGTCCLLQSDTKNKWCRAEIVHIDTTAVLNLVDYGHYESISYEECARLKRIPEQLTNLPKVTYPCILRGVKPVGVDGQWSDDAAVFFQQCLYQKNLQIFFREFVSNTHWKVDILTHGVHVAKELVDAGHASYIDIMLGLRFQPQSPCKAAPCSPDSGEECGQKDEGSNRKSGLLELTDGVEGKMPLRVVSGFRQCFLM